MKTQAQIIMKSEPAAAIFNEERKTKSEKKRVFDEYILMMGKPIVSPHPRRRKLRIARFRAYQKLVCAKTHSLRCSSSPQKVCDFSGTPF